METLRGADGNVRNQEQVLRFDVVVDEVVRMYRIERLADPR